MIQFNDRYRIHGCQINNSNKDVHTNKAWNSPEAKSNLCVGTLWGGLDECAMEAQREDRLHFSPGDLFHRPCVENHEFTPQEGRIQDDR